MEVPAKAADVAFEREFVRGTILLTEMRFEDGTTKQKFIIVLNKDPSGATTLLVLTTSQTDYFSRYPKADHITIQAGSLPCFDKETVIDCREVWSMERSLLKKRFQEGALKFAGNLENIHLEQVDRLVASSRSISLRDKKEILGWQ